MTTTSPKPFVFVLMPFAAKFDDVYKLGIKPACEAVGAYAERIDEQIFAESILDRIYNQIAKADVIVADMTGKNPNVFYEAGYAHALGKKVILLTQKSKDIPFDLKHYPHIVYGGRITGLIPELEKKVGWAIKRPRQNIPLSTVSFFIDGKALPEKKGIINDAGEFPITNFLLKIDVHNPIERQIKIAKFQIGILTDNRLKEIGKINTGVRLKKFKQLSGKFLYLDDVLYELLPGSWASVQLQFEVDPNSPLEKSELIGAVVRAFSETGTEDFSFRVKVVGHPKRPPPIRKIEF